MSSGCYLRAESNWLKGVVVGGGIEASEAQLYDRLKDDHKYIAAIIKPSAIEATIVGATPVSFLKSRRL